MMPDNELTVKTAIQVACETLEDAVRTGHRTELDNILAGLLAKITALTKQVESQGEEIRRLEEVYCAHIGLDVVEAVEDTAIDCIEIADAYARYSGMARQIIIDIRAKYQIEEGI